MSTQARHIPGNGFLKWVFVVFVVLPFTVWVPGVGLMFLLGADLGWQVLVPTLALTPLWCLMVQRLPDWLPADEFD